MAHLPIIALCLLTDIVLWFALTRLGGAGLYVANIGATGGAGLVALAWMLGGRPAGDRRHRAAIALSVLWIGIIALLGGHLLTWLLVNGWSTRPAKLGLSIGFAITTPAVIHRLLNRDGALTGGRLAGTGVGAVILAVLALVPQASMPKDSGDDVRALYQNKRAPADRPLRVFQIGHSLVGRDMPAMLAQLAGEGHGYELQLGWGTTLREHFEPDLTINGFDVENATPRYRDAHEALASGEYDAFVMTEMVSLKDAIRYHDSREYAARWAAEAVAGNPDIQIFLYESWHGLDDKTEWLDRLPNDLEEMWKNDLLWPATRAAGRAVWLIPVGQVMARLVAEAEASPDGIGEMKTRADLFTDNIHPNDLGAYLVALTHYAVLYGKSPVGLPKRLMLADDTHANAPSDLLARRMQEVVWEVVTTIPETGIAAAN